MFLVVVFVLVVVIFGISSHVKEHVTLTGDGFDLVVVDVSDVVVVELAPAVVTGEITGYGGVMAGVRGLAVVRDARGEVRESEGGGGVRAR